MRVIGLALIAAALLLSACGQAQAPADAAATTGADAAQAETQPDEAAGPPPEIVAARQSYASNGCAEATPVMGPNFERTADFNGDGRLDYIFDTNEFRCAEFASPPFCGSGGCTVEVFLSTPTGYESVFNMQFGDAAVIAEANGATVLRDSATGSSYGMHADRFGALD
ncbi:MAG: hypothetical protein AB7J28_12310 [Hyphomonadaceae bacterium]